MAGVTISGVRKVYAGGIEAVKGIDLEVPDGAFCVLVGPSGCGKSTLLRLVAGLETLSAGDISIGGRLVNDREPAERDIAMVFQNYALYPHMSVYDNLAYGLKNRKTPRDEIDNRVREAARMLEISDYLARKPRELSGGQRQRVAMGRAIVRRPQVFLFDEPLSNLDAKLRVSMRVEIRRLQRSLATTAIYVTHDQLEAMTLADLLVVMNGGRIEQIGAPLDVYRRPQTTFVAAFIGAPAMNLMTASPSEAERFGGVATIGVRPEHLAFATSGSPAPNGGLAFELTVAAVERLGPESLVYGSDAAGRDLIVRRSGEDDPPIGARLVVVAEREHLHRFDAQGRRMAN
jgi:sn-glycerol 3-phosphate transport system ATP-binding protein